MQHDLTQLILGAGSLFFLYKFLQGFLKKQREKHSIVGIKQRIKDLNIKRLNNLSSMVNRMYNDGGTIKLIEDITNYTIIVEYSEKHCEFMNYHLHSDNKQPIPKKYNYVLRKEKLEQLEKLSHC